MIDEDTAPTTTVTEDASAFTAGAGQDAPPAPAADTPPAQGEAPTPPPSREELQAKDVEAFRAAAEKAEQPSVPRETPAAEAVAKPETPAKPAAEAAPAETQPTNAEAAEKAVVEEQIVTLGIKNEKAKEKFRELSQRPTKEAVEEIVAPLREQAQRMQKFDEIVSAARATGEQIQSAFGYLQAINSGDPRRMSEAADAMLKETTWLFKRLGRELPGVVDPLADHPDLAQAVEAGDITRKFALETANARTMQARTAEHSQRTTEEAQYQHEVQVARTRLDTIGKELFAADAAQYQAKYPYLLPQLEFIRDNLPPNQWEQAVLRAYSRLPYTPAAATPPPVAAPHKPPVGAVPLRPTGGNGAMRAAVPADPVAAFRFGAENAR